jgi:hypothetical protein
MKKKDACNERVLERKTAENIKFADANPAEPGPARLAFAL